MTALNSEDARSHRASDLAALPYRVKRLSLLLGLYIDRALKEHGLGRSQWQVLTCLSATGELTQRELQSTLLVEPATLTAIVDALAEKGWVERAEGAPDRRVRMVKMTLEGRRRFSASDDPIQRVSAVMVEGVSDGERERFARNLTRMIGTLERENARLCKTAQQSPDEKTKD